jgi:6-phosphogluconate dehydrogenase
MRIGMVGLGRMGANMARRLLRGGHEVVAWDRDAAPVRALAGEGAAAASSIDDLVRRLEAPRVAWVMLPAGAPTEGTVAALGERLAAGDVVVDGGNAHFKDDVRRARGLAARGIHYVDVGTSGGVFGLERGYALMVGGDAGAVKTLAPALRTLAPGRAAAPPTPGRAAPPGATAEDGWLHCGPPGAGHFVKMVHNGIEYGMMQAFAEGFDVLRGAAGPDVPEEHRYELDLAEIAEVWRRGSVVSSWLLDLAAAALARDPGLEGFTGRVPDSGEGRWTVETAVEEGVPATVLAAALFARFRSRADAPFGDKLLSAMRREFGGHAEAPPAPGAAPRGPRGGEGER